MEGRKEEEHAKVQCNICGKWLPAIPPVRCCGVVILDVIREESKVERLKWYLKQLLPLVYVSTFTGYESKEAYIARDGKRQLCIWKMWLGRSFNIQYFDLAS